MSKGSVVVALTFCLAFSQALAQKAEPPAAIEYKPPPRGAPVKRISGGARAIEVTVAVAPALTVLAPNHVALTASEQPALYWYQSVRGAVRMEVSLVDASGSKPLIETSYTTLEPGIHRVDLKDLNVRLKPDQDYQWSAMLTPADKQRPSAIVSQASFRLTEMRSETLASVAARPKDQQAVAYASMGIWHDALDTLSESISASPDPRELRNMRAALLEQGGLKAAAEFDRNAAR